MQPVVITNKISSTDFTSVFLLTLYLICQDVLGSFPVMQVDKKDNTVDKHMGRVTDVCNMLALI